jgi:hypothetical protein
MVVAIVNERLGVFVLDIRYELTHGRSLCSEIFIFK